MEKNPRDSFVRLLQENNLSELDLAGLIEYGIVNLPTDKDRPDLELADFFFVLSERNDIDSNNLDLVTDAFVYCKNSPDFPVPSNYIDIRTKYKELSGHGMPRELQ